ncbi:MAG: tetratricopeptide repeat protein, partial [Mycobacteriales bacterium]
DQGDAAAQFNLGVAYAQGRGVPQDPSAAADWYRKAAEQANLSAEVNLGVALANGQGVAQDASAAATWFRKAMDQGSVGAAFDLGVLYHNGQGVGRDYAEAARLYRKAADQGDADAQFNLGLMYALGEGVPRDDAEAGRWYKLAAQQGYAGIEFYYRQLPATPGRLPQTQFHAMMDAVFGAGAWRETGGYRSPARENQLRAEGALTVPEGRLSRHSMGTPDAPGAYDIVVAGMSPEQAAARLHLAWAHFSRLFPEGLHGTQGAHLHIEP